MASKVPMVRQISWFFLLLQGLLLGLLILIFYLLGTVYFYLLGPLVYLIISFGLRTLMLRDHQKGIKLVKQGKFMEAIPFFEKSVDYFSNNSRADKYRFITTFTPSKMSFREMGLCNIAFCYTQTGNGAKAKEIYQSVLKDYPENTLASTALNLFDSIKNKN